MECNSSENEPKRAKLFGLKSLLVVGYKKKLSTAYYERFVEKRPNAHSLISIFNCRILLAMLTLSCLSKTCLWRREFFLFLNEAFDLREKQFSRKQFSSLSFPFCHWRFVVHAMLFASAVA